MRTCKSLLINATLVGALLTPGCTDADLELVPPGRPFLDNKLAVVGDLCTTSPESRVFPLRILFVVDASESMLVNDPPDPVTGETNRERAVRETWEELLAGGPEGVRVGIIRFSSEAQSRTPVDYDADGLADSYFTADQTQLAAATLALRATDRKTNYLNALGEAYFEIRNELVAADKESLPLSKYVVVFVSDGVPQEEDEEQRENSEENILDSVRAIQELGELFHVGDLKLHTAYLSSTEGTLLDQEAQSLLQKMADTGGGNFRSFPSGETINFLFVDFTIIRRVFTLKTLSVTNANALVDINQIKNLVVDPNPRSFVDLDGDLSPACGEPLVDTDGDNLADFMEAEIGTDPHVADTDDDGLWDRLEWRLRTSGLDPLDPDDARCYIPEQCFDVDADTYCDCLLDLDADGTCDCVVDPDTPCADALGHDCVDNDVDGLCDCPDFDDDGRCDYPDRDGDGLNDCQEIFFGTAQNGNDTDADGLPDWREVRALSNPTEKDWLTDADWDQTQNGTEVLAGTDLWCDDSGVRSLVSYQYDLDTLGLVGGKSCYSFTVSNITLVPTLPKVQEELPGSFWARPEVGAVPYPGNGWNRVLIFFGEVSFDDPESFASYRVACVMARYEPEGNYKSPPSGRVTLTDADFVDAREEFDADTHCIWP